MPPKKKGKVPEAPAPPSEGPPDTFSMTSTASSAGPTIPGQPPLRGAAPAAFGQSPMGPPMGVPPPPAFGQPFAVPPPPTTNLVLPKHDKKVAHDEELGELVMEETEVLPYESVFEWDCVDPLGYYNENEKFHELLDAFEGDDIKTAVVTGMWRDRAKYQILRRFTWPPPLMFKQAFLTRGYYEDYEPRPGIDVAGYHMNRDKKRRKKENQLHKGAENRNLMHDVVENIHHNVGVGAGHGLHDMEAKKRKKLEEEKERERLRLEALRKKAEEDAARAKAEQDAKKKAELEAANARALAALKAAEEAARKKKLEDEERERREREARKPKPIPPPVVAGQKRSLSDYDPLLYNRQILIIRGLAGDTKQSVLDGMFRKGIVTMKSDGKGGFDAEMEFQSERDAAEAFRLAIQTKIGGRAVNIIPQLRVPDSMVGDLDRDDLTYANPYMARKNLDAAYNEQFDKKKDKDAKPGAKPAATAPAAPLPVAKAKTKKKLNSYNPLEYDYLKLGINNIAVGTNKKDVEKLFPKGKVISFDKDPATGRMKAIVTFDERDDAIAAYADNHEQQINGGDMDIVPEKVDAESKAKKKAAKKEAAAPEFEIVEEVTYEVVKKPKKAKKE